ncbi:MAG: O-antigen ligase family protein [Chloroflexota bacterium]|nr:O-antigen ligase family protein [Chloroflexota bacterium]
MILDSLSNNSAYKVLIKFLWFLLIVGLPLTSFPILNKWTGAIVAPFSFIPLVLLLLLWMIPFIISRGKFPPEVLPILYFTAFAVIISAGAFFLDGFYDRGRNFFDQSIRAFVTLGIGLSFYLMFSAYAQCKSAIRMIFQFIYIGGALLILWTGFEVVTLRIYTSAQALPEWFRAIRSALAVQSPSVNFINRVTGFAYEPSWFVRQFNLILFPIWLSAVYQRKSIYKFRIWKIQIEDILFLGGLIIFAFSSPRIGLLAFLATLAYLAFLIMRGLHRRLTAWYIRRRKNPPRRMILVKLGLAVLMVVVVLGVTAGALLGYIRFASRWDYRFELLLKDYTLESLNFFPITETSLIYNARSLAFFERMIFWFGGWNTFNDYPFGVGLGNAGFYFIDRVHGAAFESIEMRNLIWRAGYLANTKNLWTRLLSETGFLGFAIFLTWLYLLWKSTTLIRKSQSDVLRILGLAGQFFIMAYLVEGFSMDSFAMPYQWVMTGLISAGGVVVRRELGNREKGKMESEQLVTAQE